MDDFTSLSIRQTCYKQKRCKQSLCFSSVYGNMGDSEGYKNKHIPKIYVVTDRSTITHHNTENTLVERLEYFYTLLSPFILAL